MFMKHLDQLTLHQEKTLFFMATDGISKHNQLGTLNAYSWSKVGLGKGVYDSGQIYSLWWREKIKSLQIPSSLWFVTQIIFIFKY